VGRLRRGLSPPALSGGLAARLGGLLVEGVDQLVGAVGVEDLGEHGGGAARVAAGEHREGLQRGGAGGEGDGRGLGATDVSQHYIGAGDGGPSDLLRGEVPPGATQEGIVLFDISKDEEIVEVQVGLTEDPLDDSDYQSIEVYGDNP